eukprot:TRINITY_DN5210_c0_g1_i1.p1 TRINITY_DN5210_c0_g1~~TRINITY_DN5210_c0_g1_i1.p1  ORF type:complete len:147 (+),score=20.99 TRINITY_DN5210_c0_g1_i1:111-551(+)
MSSLPFTELGVMGRSLIQLKRMSFYYSKSLNHSHGIRKYLNEDLVEFATKFPSVALYLRQDDAEPRIEAEYLSGTKKAVSLKKSTSQDVNKEVWMLRCQSGINVGQIVRYWHTTRPSIQGNWHPFMFPFPDNSQYTIRDCEDKSTE